jgi:hypothetical protein
MAQHEKDKILHFYPRCGLDKAKKKSFQATVRLSRSNKRQYNICYLPMNAYILNNMYFLPGCMTAAVEYTAGSLKGAGNEIFPPILYEQAPSEHLNALQNLKSKNYSLYFLLILRNRLFAELRLVTVTHRELDSQKISNFESCNGFEDEFYMLYVRGLFINKLCKLELISTKCKCFFIILVKHFLRKKV